MTAASLPLPTGPFGRAIERGDWSLAATYLLLGVSRAAARLPPDSLVALVELLGSFPATEGGRRGG
jgi:hypothetical protein